MSSDNKNILLAVVAMLGFLLLWDVFVSRRYNSGAPKPPPAATASPIEKEVSPDSSFIRKDSPSSIHPERREVVLKTDRNEVVFDTLGAQIKRWSLYERDHWIGLYPAKPANNNVQEGTLSTFSDLIFSAVVVNNQEIRFSAHHPQGFEIEKTFKFFAEPPFHQLTIKMTNSTGTPIQVDASLNWVGGLSRRTLNKEFTAKEESAVESEMRAVGYGERVVSFKPGFIFGRSVETRVPSPLTWLGVDNHYFLAAVISKDQSIKNAAIQTSHSLLPQVQIPLQTTLEAHQTVTKAFLLYVGPKSFEQLNKLDYGIAKAVDFGMFGIIAKALLKALNFFHGLTENYGWAIILLTICVQLLVMPLTRKSLKHSIRMKELQPQIKILQDQFKSDPKRLQIETFNLYKKNGMKLMGMEGCFPMLLQMPVFFAFYATMQAAYELRGAPWIFWIHDLGAKDPYYLLPILMGLGMFAQQKLTAVAADPAQARIMMLMPVMFTFMFANLPSGLVLYWLTNSLMSIAIQQIFMWKAKKSQLHTASITP